MRCWLLLRVAMRLGPNSTGPSAEVAAAEPIGETALILTSHGVHEAVANLLLTPVGQM